MTKAKTTMIITIVQAEIETAIRNYINEQINIREGQSVSIELQATRGSEGFKAVIDITTISTTAAPAPKPAFPAFTTVTAPLPNVTQRIPQTPAEARQLMESQYEAEAAAEVTTDVALEVADAMAHTTEVQDEPITGTSANSNSSEAAVVRPQSLFKGLRKPVNA